MKKIIISCLLLFPFLLTAQKITIKDSSNNRPIEFAVIKFGENGFYSNKKGQFNLNQIDLDSFTVHSMGYESKNLKKEETDSLILLQPKPTHLSEVTIDSKNRDTLQINPGRKIWWFSNVSNWLLHKKGEELIAILHPKKDCKSAIIKKVAINFDKVREHKNLKNKNHKILIRLKAYDVKNDSLLKHLKYKSSPTPVNAFSKDGVEFDLENSQLLFQKEGIALIVEMIDFKGKENLPQDITPILRPSLTKKGNNKYFSTKTYIKNNLEQSDELIPIKERLQKQIGKKLNRNLSVGLEIIK